MINTRLWRRESWVEPLQRRFIVTENEEDEKQVMHVRFFLNG
jgi:hypothetical protein